MTTGWLQKVVKPQAQTRLYVFPYAGGNSASFLPWAASLGPDVDLAVVHLPGRGFRIDEPPVTDMHKTAMSVISAILEDNARQFAFFGHSMGAVLMLEVARIATLMHLRMPQIMVASGCRWPGQIKPERLHDLPETQLIDRLRDMGGTPREVLENTEMMEIALPALRADFAMLHAYRYKPSMAVKAPLHVFAGRDDAIVKAEHLNGWLRETEQPGKVHWFDGAHFFIHRQQQEVLTKLTELLR